MYWDFSKKNIWLFLICLCIATPSVSVAETGIVSGIGYGRDVNEAIAALLRSVILKNFRSPESANLLKNVIQQEIIPNSSAFVQSYRLLDGVKGKSISVSANVDLEVVRSLISVTPQRLQEEGIPKVLILVQGASLPEPQKEKDFLNPFQAIEVAGWERFERRGFAPVKLSEEEVRAAGDEQVSTPEFLRGLGAKAGARLAVGISGKFEQFENENSQNKETKLVLNATIYDVKMGRILGKKTLRVSTPKSRRDQFAIDLQKILQEESKGLYHEVIVDAGSKLGKSADARDFVVMRVGAASSYQLINKFRIALESHKDIRGVVEYSIGRGFVDLSVRPMLPAPTLVKILKSLNSEDFAVSGQVASEEKIEEGGNASGLSKLLPIVTVELKDKKLESSEGVKSEN